MARDRQRAKQRQAERRARRLEARGDGDPTPARTRAEPDADRTEPELVEEPAAAPDALAPPAEPAPDALAPPAEPQPLPPVPPEEEPVLDEEALDDALEDVEEGFDEELDELEEDEAYDPRTVAGPKGRRTRSQDEAAGSDEHRRRHGKVVTFLLNVWAELQRVQWPDRQAVTTLTGVVLGFVLIAGGYLGLLDAIFSRLIEAIL